MKLCPHCNRTYSDDSLRFCLDDGTVLTRDPNATLPYGPITHETVTRPPVVVSQQPRSPHVPAMAPSLPTNPVHAPVHAIPPSSSSSPILTAGVVLIVLFLFILTVVGIVFIYKYWNASESTALPASSSTPTPLQESSNSDRARPGSAGAPQIRTSASSVRYAVQTNTYDSANVIDGSKRTAWIEGVDGPGIGEWLRFDFGREINLHRIVILPGYFKSPQIWAQNNRLAAVTLQFSNGTSNQFTFVDRMERQTLDLGTIKTRWVRLVIDDVFSGSDPDTAVSEITFEWEP
jgi:hypothetical protein